MINRKVLSRSRSQDAEPRCRVRNRRWRKSHQNKNLAVPRTSVRTGCENMTGTDRRGFPAGSLRDTKTAAGGCTSGGRNNLQDASAFEKDQKRWIVNAIRRF